MGKERLYEIVEERRFNRRKEENSLEEAIKAEDRELAREAKRLRLQAIIKRREKEIRELEGEKGSKKPKSSEVVASTLALLGADTKKLNEILSNLSPEAMRNLTLLVAASSGNPTALLPIAMMARTEGVKPTEIADTIAKYVELATKGKEPAVGTADIVSIVDKVIEAVKPEGKGVPSYVEKVVDELKETRKMLTEERFKAIEKEIQAVKQPHPREYIKQFREDAEFFGLKPGKTGELDIKLEELRTNTQLEIAKLQLETQKWMLEKELERDKWGFASNIINPLIAVAGRPIAEKIRSLGRAGGEYQPPPRTGRAVLSVPCTCGNIISVRPPYPEVVVCPACKTELKREVVGQSQSQGTGEKPPRTD